MEITVQDVQARWAYSEIVGAKASHCYDGSPGIEALRAKHNDGVLFADLSALERAMLTQGWLNVRQYFLRFMDGLTAYRTMDLTKTQIAALLVPHMVSTDIKEDFVTFATFMGLPREDAGDPRGEIRSFQVYADPLTISLHGARKVLIDGYHRAVSFWKSAPEGAVIATYDPIL